MLTLTVTAEKPHDLMDQLKALTLTLITQGVVPMEGEVVMPLGAGPAARQPKVTRGKKAAEPVIEQPNTADLVEAVMSAATPAAETVLVATEVSTLIEPTAGPQPDIAEVREALQNLSKAKGVDAVADLLSKGFPGLEFKNATAVITASMGARVVAEAKRRSV